MLPHFDLTNRLALVTGSSRGLGLAIAQGLAAAGARVILHGRDQARLAQQAAALPNAAGTLAFDVTDAAGVRAAFGRIEAEHGRLDILVNNAGVIPRRPCWRPPTRTGSPSSTPTLPRISAWRGRRRG